MICRDAAFGAGKAAVVVVVWGGHVSIIVGANKLVNYLLAFLFCKAYYRLMHKPKTLLARAKSITKKARVSKPIDKQAAALSVAWALGEVTYTQAQGVLARSRGASVYAVLACGLRDAIRLGMLQQVPKC